MDIVHVRLPPGIRQRVNLAAAAEDVRSTDYVRGCILKWLRQDPKPAVGPVECESDGRPHRLSLSSAHRIQLRTAAAERDVSPSVLVVRILHTHTPHPTELLLRSATVGISPRS